MISFLHLFQQPKEDKRDHDYDAVKYPSSTTVLSVIDTGFDLMSLGEEALSILSSRGTYIHAVLESLFKKESVPTWRQLGLDKKHKPSNLRDYTAGALKLYKQYEDKYEVFSMEERIFPGNPNYAMQPDGIFKCNGEYILVDFKTISSALPKDDPLNGVINLSTKYWCQLASYLWGIEKHYGIKIAKAAILGIDQKGKTYHIEKTKEELSTHLELFFQAREFYENYYGTKNIT